MKQFTIEKQDGSQVQITGEIPFTELAKHRASAIAALGKDIEIDGFRKGHVPEKVLVEKLGEMRILSEMAERTLAKVYPEAVKEHNLEVIGYPQVSITKLAPDNPMGFTATVAVVPEITLPDYKKTAAEVNKDKASVEVTDADVEDQIKDIMRQKIAYERLQKKAAAGAKHVHEDGTVHDGPAHGEGTTDLPTPESEAAKEEEEEFDPEKIELPELTDEYVKELGQPGQFETVADFKAKLREHLEIEKKREVEAAHRAKLTDKIIEDSTFALPQVLIDSEINQMFAQMEEDLKRANLKMDDYLSHIKKTKENLIKEWTPAAEKRARLQLVLNEIAKREDVTPDKEQLDTQVKQLLEQYKDADEARVRVYVASVMMNEAVMKMLEEQK
ncbi:trigger factor [Candidatus Nomurabacteria bacterium]|nr:trigger factor [Candidatus Nomurabacteria bacterium]